MKVCLLLVVCQNCEKNETVQLREVFLEDHKAFKNKIGNFKLVFIRLAFKPTNTYSLSCLRLSFLKTVSLESRV